MSVLIDWEIEDLITKGELIIDPVDLSLINPASLDFRLGNEFTWTQPTNHTIVPNDNSSFIHRTEKRDFYILKPKEMILGTTLESFTFPKIVGVKVMGKSSLGRLGLDQSSVAGWIDPGFSCQGITLELFNASDNPIELIPGMKIGQLVFFKCEVPRKDYSVTGRYQNQVKGEGSKGV